MIKKICSRCGRTYDVGTQCSCKADRTDYYRKYDKEHPERHERYNSVEWKAVRQAVLARAHGMDEYVWATQHRVVVADTVHHIEPVDENPALWLRMDNLIAVASATHNKIHSAYKRGDKEAMQRRLREIVQTSPTLKKF